MSNKFRSFLAIDIEPNLINKILDIQSQLKSNEIISNSEDTLKYVKKSNFHFTLKFFGDINSEKIIDIENSVRDVLNNYSNFNINIGCFGTFPHIKSNNKINNSQVLWIGLNDTHNTLSKLQKELDTNFSNMGFKKEKNYKSHIRIARIKYINNKYRFKSNTDFLNELTHEIKN